MKLCFATNNPHKLKEVKALLPESLTLLSLQDIGCTEELPETQETIEDNSYQKAEFVFSRCKCSCFADDTGLEVDCLGGKPGVYSSRYAGIPANPENNIKKLLQELQNEPNRKARFRAVVTLILEDSVKQFEGILPGKIVDTPKGEKGFGYDPVFLPEGYDITLAEMEPDQKNKISHRGIAIRKLISFLTENFAS